MALFDDGPINRTEDLAAYDSAVLDTAKAEGIDTDGKIALAQSAIATDVTTFLVEKGPMDALFGWTDCWRRRKLGTSDVVVGPALKRWHALKAIAAIYEDAYGQQANNRYQWKWQQFENLTSEARGSCMALGIGLVAAPVSKATEPIVSLTAGTGAPATVYFAVSFVNAGGQEGCASDPVQTNIAAATQAEVMTGAPPANAVAWHIYAGAWPHALARQNSAALSIGATWLQPAALAGGELPGNGQTAQFFAVENRITRRG